MTPHTLAAAFTNPIAATNMQQLLAAILKSALYIIFPILVLMIIYTGFLFIRAQGNPAKLEEAKRAFFWTVMGAILALGSWALAVAIGDTVTSIVP